MTVVGQHRCPVGAWDASLAYCCASFEFVGAYLLCRELQQQEPYIGGTDWITLSPRLRFPLVAIVSVRVLVSKFSFHFDKIKERTCRVGDHREKLSSEF